MKKIKNIIIRLNQIILYFGFIHWIRLFIKIDKTQDLSQLENLDRPLIIISNHVSMWDNFTILASLGLRTPQISWRIPTAQIHYDKFLFRIFFILIGTYPLKAKGCFEKSLDKTIQILRAGYSMNYFPEGKMASYGRPHPTKKGIAYITESVDVYFLPIYLEYPHKNSIRPGIKINNTKVKIGKLIKSEDFKNYKINRHEAIMDMVWDLAYENEFEENAYLDQCSYIPIKVEE